MSLFEIVAMLITLAAVLSYINHRLFKLPTTIGLMFLTLAGCVGLMIYAHYVPVKGTFIEIKIHNIVSSINFEAVLMEAMLGLLLFAGALHVNINDLLDRKWLIGILATLGVVTSTFMIGGLFYYSTKFANQEVDFIYCLLFGALITPTDPIAVLAILKKAGAPKGIEVKLAGESLFNDGIAVVVFLAILGIAMGELEPSASAISTLLIEEAGGGVLLGLALGFLGYILLKSVDDYQLEILITLAIVVGGYALAPRIHVSGPLAMVIAGLLIGNRGRRLAMSEKTIEHLDTFWELVDELLNSLLFVLIGLEVLILTWSQSYLMAGLVAIPICLIARFCCVAVPISFLKSKQEFSPHAIRLLTWGGLRGGIAVALALAIPKSIVSRELILSMTYVVVVFSILVQGVTIKYLVKRA